MPDATYTLLVDWDNNGVFTGTGEDVSSRIQHLEWSRGRDRASQLTGRSIASRLTAILDNRSGDYSSFNTSSPIAGNIKPGRKVRLQGGSGSFPYTFPIVFNDKSQFNGYLESLKPLPSLHGAHKVVLEAEGPLGHFGGNEVRRGMQTSVATGTEMKAILDAEGVPTDASPFDAGQTTMTRSWFDRQRLVSILRQIEVTEGGFVLENKDGEIAFEDRHHRMTGTPHTTSQATFSDASGAARAYTDPQQIDPVPFIFNDFEAVVQLYTVGSLATLWTLAETGSASPLLAVGESKTFWATYPNPDSGTDAFGVDAWTTPVSTTDYTANTQSGGGGTDRTSDVGVAVTKFGEAMKITLTNNHASDPIYITLLQSRGTPITRDDPIRINEEDSTSQTDFGKRTWPSKAKFIPDSQEALDWAKYNLSIYKDPVPYLQLTIIANRSHNELVEALTREISDRVTIVANNSANLGINEDFYIEAEKHMVTNYGKLHRTTFMLSPVSAFGGFWALDVGDLDGNTRLAY